MSFFQGYNNDIALLVLNQDAQWSPYVRPVCLPDFKADGLKDAMNVLVAGWGRKDEAVNGVYYSPLTDIWYTFPLGDVFIGSTAISSLCTGKGFENVTYFFMMNGRNTLENPDSHVWLLSIVVMREQPKAHSKHYATAQITNKLTRNAQYVHH